MAVEVHQPAPNVGPYPKVQGRCPACHLHSLFLGGGGYITCGYLPCPDPTAVTDMLCDPPASREEDAK